MITVTCINWGTLYGPEYVQRLKSSIERNSTVPFRFVCLSDKKIPGVETIELTPGYETWWNKLQVLDPSKDLGNRIVNLDIDLIIVDNIDWLLTYNGDFMGIHDLACAYNPSKRGTLQSGIFAANRRSCKWIWEYFEQNSDAIRSKIRGDGEFLDWILKASKFDFEYLQDLYGETKYCSYKYTGYPIVEPLNNNLDEIKKAFIENDISIIDFHGRISMKDAITADKEVAYGYFKKQDWIKEYWK
jgi:hypothetical protein